MLGKHDHVVVVRDEIVGPSQNRTGDYPVIARIARDRRYLWGIVKQLR
jgi:hypothetical protein